MDIQTILILILIGLAAGVLGGFVGVGGGIIIVPALVYFLGQSQMMAQGTSILLMLPPIGIAAAMNYHKTGNINISFGIVIASAFVLGGYFGSKWALKINQNIVKMIFGGLLLFVAIKMTFSGIQEYKNEKRTNSNH